MNENFLALGSEISIFNKILFERSEKSYHNFALCILHFALITSPNKIQKKE